jgi:hypothetical protein
VIKKGIKLNNRKLVNMILFADDQIIMATSEDDFQTMAHHLNLIARKYKMTISSAKTKSMTMWGNRIQRVKIVINDNIIEEVTEFKYLEYIINDLYCSPNIVQVIKSRRMRWAGHVARMG